MPIKTEREYRSMSLLTPSSTNEKRFNSDFYVEGYATTFNKPYVLYEIDGNKYYEVVDKNAFNGCDLSDCIMQYDHNGRVFARNKMAQNKPATLIVEPNNIGLFIAADLSLTDESRKMYDELEKGLIYQMSFAFTVTEHSYDRDTRTRTILKVKKVYDVSAVSIPANPATEISARSWIDGVIEAEKQELLERQNQLALAKAKALYFINKKY